MAMTASAAKSAADERRGRAVPVPLGFGAADFGRRALTDRPALESRLMGLPEAYERHGSGLGLWVGSVALFIAIEVPADLSCWPLRTSAVVPVTGLS